MSAEATLIKQIAQKDRQAFAKLYEMYQPMVLRYCGRLLNHDVETAADIADEVFFEVWQKSANFRGDSTVKTWLFSIAHHKSVSYIRKNREASLDNEEQVNQMVSFELGQEQVINKQQHHEMLAKAIEQLSIEHKEVLHLFYYSDMSIKEIALTVQVNEQTVRTRLHYAKKYLLPILTSMGVNADNFFERS